jgi:hypothetical protein
MKSAKIELMSRLTPNFSRAVSGSDITIGRVKKRKEGVW